ncbi:MAG: LPS export ABC transporter periplasmic protein LptC [Brevundimonas sp.]
MDELERRTEADEARVARTAERFRARARRVQLARRALPVAILVLAGGALSWTVLRTIISGVEREASQSREIRLDNPVFHGQDALGRSFVIGAEGAVRDPESGFFRLNGPVLRLNLGGDAVTELTADAGVYDQAKKTVTLGANVRIVDADSGFRLTSPEAVVDTDTGVVTGNKGIEGTGPLGTIRASAYAIHDQGERIELFGRPGEKVRGTLSVAGD